MTQGLQGSKNKVTEKVCPWKRLITLAMRVSQSAAMSRECDCGYPGLRYLHCTVYFRRYKDRN